MKLRIQDNAIRFRLSQTEVSQLVYDGMVTSRCMFSKANLHYTILKNEDTHVISADFSENEVKVCLPSTLVSGWDMDDRVGFDAYDTNGLYILIEKDFKCLQPRLHEDESDLFANPNINHEHCP
jgi:hypothetical protein